MMAFRCAICHEIITDETRNNPYPVEDHGDCCEYCNTMVVMPARSLMKELSKKSKDALGDLIDELELKLKIAQIVYDQKNTESDE